MTLSNKPNNFDSLAFQLSHEIHRHTIQFLAQGGKYRHKPYGTGVLLFVNNKCLIITAAHVVEDFDNTPLFVNSSKGIIPVVGDLRETNTDKDKSIDLAYIILDDSIAQILVQTYSFIPLSKILGSHRPAIGNPYLVVGYPEVNIRASQTERQVYSGSSTFLLTLSKEKVYNYLGFEIYKHYVLDFAGKGTNLSTQNTSRKIEDPYGMSGCGLWLLSVKQSYYERELQYQLIGIMTEFRKGKYHCLIGNRIDMILSALAKLEEFEINLSYDQIIIDPFIP